MKINEDKLREAILLKFETQAKFAKKAGLNDAQVSTGIKNQTVHFLNACRKVGIDLDALNEEESTKTNNLTYRLKITESRIKELEDIIDKQKNLIESYELILKNKFLEKQ